MDGVKDGDVATCPEKESGGDEEARAPLLNQNLTNFTASDKELLVFLVKQIQKAKGQGSAGDWHLYLETVAKTSKLNPAAHSWEVLAGFIGTLMGVPNIKLIRRLKKWFAKKKAAEELERIDPCPDTAEQKLLMCTRAHPEYSKSYDLPSHGAGWIVSGRGPTNQFCEPERLLSLDCEMCLSVNGVKEVIKTCVVDRDLNVLVNTDVRPTLEVADYCTEVTGINAENLGKDGIISFLELQSRMLALLTPGTILIGHSLHHDLRALKIDHPRVIDTSLLFQFTNMERALPGLSLVCKTVLNETMRDGSSKVHDCLQDAIMPMKLVLHQLANGPTPLLGAASETVSEEDQRKLFVHRILRGISESAIQTVIPSCFSCKVEEIKWSAKRFGTTYVSFKTVKDTELAFLQIKGCLNEDGCGKLQKAVPITVPGQGIASVIHVRKMVRQQQPAACLQSLGGKPAEQKNMVNQREKERFLRGTTVCRVDLRGGCEIVSEDGRRKMQLELKGQLSDGNQHSDGEIHALENGKSKKEECKMGSGGKEGLPEVSDKKRKSVEGMLEKNSGTVGGERNKKAKSRREERNALREEEELVSFVAVEGHKKCGKTKMTEVEDDQCHDISRSVGTKKKKAKKEKKEKIEALDKVEEGTVSDENEEKDGGTATDCKRKAGGAESPGQKKMKNKAKKGREEGKDGGEVRSNDGRERMMDGVEDAQGKGSAEGERKKKKKNKKKKGRDEEKEGGDARANNAESRMEEDVEGALGKESAVGERKKKKKKGEKGKG